MSSFTLPVPPPLSKTTNNVPGVGRVKSKEYKAWIKQAGQELMIQRVKHVESPVQIHWVLPYNGRRDFDNYKKALLDVLVKFGVITDDSMKHWAYETTGYSHDITDVQVTVEPFQINT